MSQIKSKERVKELAEVYTNEREVNAMLDLIPIKNKDELLNYTYLEPACGNGNFLTKILERKLMVILMDYNQTTIKRRNVNTITEEIQYKIIFVLSTIFGVDICQENVEESRERLKVQVESFYSQIISFLNLIRINTKNKFKYESKMFFNSVDYILSQNIICGDTINKADKITIVETKIKKPYFIQTKYNFLEMVENDKAKPLGKPKKIHYLKLGEKNEPNK
jgi:hypothetical protein